MTPACATASTYGIGIGSNIGTTYAGGSSLSNHSNLSSQLQLTNDTGLRRRMFAGFRPLSGFGRLRNRPSQNRSISLPESNYVPTTSTTTSATSTTAIVSNNCKCNEKL